MNTVSAQKYARGHVIQTAGLHVASLSASPESLTMLGMLPVVAAGLIEHWALTQKAEAALHAHIATSPSILQHWWNVCTDAYVAAKLCFHISTWSDL